MKVLGKSIYSDGTLFHIDDNGKARTLSEPTLGKYIQEGKVENASVVRKQGSRPFVRLASGVLTKEFSFPMPKFEQSYAKKEASIAKKWALAKNGIVNATASAPAKQRCVAFRFSGGNIFEVVTIALPEGDVKGAEFALYKTLVEKCGLSKTEASSSASMASVWVVQGNAPKSAFKQISFDPVSGFKIQCKAVEAVPTVITPEPHHIAPKQTAPSNVKMMTREDHAKQAHGLIKEPLKNANKKSVNNWKNDVIGWLSEHEGAYADAMRRIGKPADYDPYDDDGLTDSDFEKLVGWICDHDQVSNDFEHKFGKSAYELLDEISKDRARSMVSKAGDKSATVSKPAKIPKGWDEKGIRKRGVEGIRKDAKRCEKFMSKIRTVGDLKAKMDKLEDYEIQDCIEVYIDGKESDQLAIDEVLEMSDDIKICSFRLEVFGKVEFPCINFKKNGDYTLYFDIYPYDYDPDNALAEDVTIEQFEKAFPPSVDNTKTPSQKKLADAEKAVVKQMADRAKANESATLKRIEELCEQYERGNAYQREDSEIEVGINETGTFYTVSDYSESRGGSEYLQNLVPVKDVSKDAVRKLCNKHGWYITF